MRIVTTPNFCKVCLEGLWLALLKRLSLIDNVAIRCDGNNTALEASFIPLAVYRREEERIEGEEYTFTWSKDGQVLSDFTNKSKVVLPPERALGNYKLEVDLVTPEVILDKDRILHSVLELEVSKTCDWYEAGGV